MNNDNTIVSVCMITYNHELYIKDAIEGVLMQKLNFPIELVIGEDCSTDNTRQICEDYASKYSEINLLPLEKNIGMIKNFLRTAKSCKGEFIALCDGDDYWTDPLKLQTQVDFLLENEDYGLVYTDALIYDQENNAFKNTFSSYSDEKPVSGDIFNRLLIRNFIQTLTVLVRRKYLLIAIENLKESFNFKMGDYPLWLEIASFSNIKYINKVTAVYRESSNSASSQNSIEEKYEFIQSIFDVQFYFCKKYNLIEIQEKLQVDYCRVLCNRAFDLRIKSIDKKIIESFVPISIKDRIIKFSFSCSIANTIVRLSYRIYSFFKK